MGGGLALALLALALTTATASAAATGSITGTVTAEDTHLGIEEVEVCAYPEEEGGEFEEFEWLCVVTEGAGGEYAIEGLPAGEYVVEFWPGEGPYLPEYYDNREFLEEADPVTVVPATTTPEIDAELARSAGIEGTVRSPLGEPLEEVLVCAGTEEWGWVECGETGSDGRYAIGDLLPGEYKVGFSAYWTGLNLLDQFWDHEPSWASADPISLAAGGLAEGIDADLEPGAEIAGTVRAAASGLPLPGILVCAFEAASGEWYECTETNSAGSYALIGLPARGFKVGFSLEYSEILPGEFDEPDGYPTQFYDGKATLAEADALTTSPPGTIAGIDASLGTPAPPALAPPVCAESGAASCGPAHATPVKRCRKGFRKRKAKGKVRCVRKHRHRHRHKHRHRHHQGRRAAGRAAGRSRPAVAIDKRLLRRRLR